MKILISPTFLITKKYLTSFTDNILINLLKLKKSHKIELINGELNHYGEISKILGKDKVFFLDELHPIYIKELCTNYFKNKNNQKLIESYPSNFNFDKQKYINLKEIIKKKIKFDFAIFSAKSFEENYKIINFLKSNKTKIVMFDKLDDQEIYFKDKNFKIADNYKFKYDIIFKQDIPIYNTESNVFPIAPIPCVLQSNYSNKNNNNFKSYNFYFSGDYRKNITRKDRFDIIEFIKKEFSQSSINITTGRKSFFSKNDQDTFLNKSKINISPSGKVWDSYRHCELANYNSPILLPKSNCKVVPGEFEDMKNCIIYETEIINNEFVITNLDNLREKISSVLKDDFIRKQLFDNYLNLIKNYHTRYKRSEYIVNILKNFENKSYA